MDTERGIIICRGVSAFRGVIQIEISAYLAANFNGGWKAYIDREKQQHGNDVVWNARMEFRVLGWRTK